MTETELIRYKKPTPDVAYKLMDFVERQTSDKYGVYSTGFFLVGGKRIFINIEGGLWHMSIDTNHPLGYYEMKELRYKFLPNDMQVGQIFPPREEFVSLRENCYHLWQLTEVEKIRNI